LATAKFAASGRRWTNKGEHLLVHAVSPERGSGSSSSARLNLLRRAVALGGQDAQGLYLTSAGFFGCSASEGNSAAGLKWPGLWPAGEERLLTALGAFASGLRDGVWLAIGVDMSRCYEAQEFWWFRGGESTHQCRVFRNRTPVADRVVTIGPFKVLGFVCGGIFGDHGIKCAVPDDVRGIDVVVDAAHASMNRQVDPAASASNLRPRWAFHRTLRRLGDHCGAVFAHAHGANDGLVRNCDNWIVYRGENPFPNSTTGIPIP